MTLPFSRLGGSACSVQSGLSCPQPSGGFRSQGTGIYKQQGQNTGQSTGGNAGGSQKVGGNKEKSTFKIFKNEEIKAPKVLLLDEKGEKLGIVTRYEALQKAEQEGLDLVQVAYNAEEMMATAKIIDFGKYQYEKKKSENEKKKANKSKGQKELKFGYNIGDNDLQMKIDTAKKLIQEGYILKMIAKLKGREKAYKDIVRIKFDYIEEELNKIGKSQGIRAEDNGFTVTVMPKK